MNLVPKFRKQIWAFIKKHGHGYRCTNCNVNAKLMSAYASEFGFDYVNFRCPKCRRAWGIEFKNKEIKRLLHIDP